MKRALLPLLLSIVLAACSRSVPTSLLPEVTAAPSILPETIPQEESIPQSETTQQEEASMTLSINGTPVTVEWEENPAVEALEALAAQGDIIIDTNAYGGFEQVGTLPQALPQADVQTTAQPGDIVLYNGDSIVLFYGVNRWAYTRLGHIEGLCEEELTALLGGSQVTLTIS